VKKYEKLKQNQISELNYVIVSPKSNSVEVRRAQAVLLLNKDDDPCMITGYSRRQCFNIRCAYYSKGLDGIEDKRKNNHKPLLTKVQREEIIVALTTKTPKDFNYEADYWTTGLLGYHIEKIYKVKYKSKTSYHLIFKDSKFTFHKPGQIYQKHNEQETQEWRKANEYKIKEALNDFSTVVLCEDEMVLSQKTTFQKIWLPKGEYPKILVSNKKEARSIYGFLNIKTGKETAFKTDWQNMYITAEVLGKLRQVHPTEKILLLWDGPGTHRGKEVTKFLENDGNIEVIYFPRYSPEQNPQEHVWREGRKQVTHNKYIENIDTTTDEFISYLNTTRFHYCLFGFGAI
jgi:transposase